MLNIIYLLNENSRSHLAINPKIGLVVALRLHARDFELKLHLVYRDFVVSRVVLQDTSEEGLCEVEAGDPEDYGRALVDPVLEELQSVEEGSVLVLQR